MSDPIRISIEAEGGDNAAEEIHKPADEVVKSEAEIIKAKEEEAEATRKIYEEHKRIHDAENQLYVEKLRRERELAEEKRKNRPALEDQATSETRGVTGQLEGTVSGSQAELLKEEALAQEKLNKLIDQEKAARDDLLKKLKEEQDQRQRLQDVRTAKSRLAAKEIEEEAALAQAAKARQVSYAVAGAAIIAVAKASLAETTRLAEAMAAADPEWAREHAVSLEMLVALNNPVQTFWDTVTGGATQSVEALQASQNELARTTAALQKMKDERAAAKAAFIDETIINQLDSERAATDATTAALERQLRVMETRRIANEAQAKYEDALALSQGADANAVKAGAVERGANDQVSRIDAKLAMLERAYRDAEEKQTEAIQAAAEAANSGSKRAKSLSAAAIKAQQEADQAYEDLKTGRENAAEEKRAVIASAKTELLGVSQDGEEAITTAAKETISALESKAKEQGGQLSQQAGAAYETLAKAVGDNIPDSQQTGLIRDAMTRLKTTTEGQGKEVLAGLNSLDISVNALAGQISAVSNRLRALEARVTSPGRIN